MRDPCATIKAIELGKVEVRIAGKTFCGAPYVLRGFAEKDEGDWRLKQLTEMLEKWARWRCPEEMASALREWLGADGLNFFRECKADHDTVSPVLKTAGSTAIPHPVHLREGMQIRNWMRKRPECEGWDAHDYDDRWTTAVEAAIGESG
jgi:hypothetical protein